MAVAAIAIGFSVDGPNIAMSGLRWDGGPIVGIGPWFVDKGIDASVATGAARFPGEGRDHLGKRLDGLLNLRVGQWADERRPSAGGGGHGQRAHDYGGRERFQGRASYRVKGWSRCPDGQASGSMTAAEPTLYTIEPSSETSRCSVKVPGGAFSGVTERGAPGPKISSFNSQDAHSCVDLAG
jgi:hypothetical protein